MDPFRPSGREGRRKCSASMRGGLFGPSSHPSCSDQADSQRADGMYPFRPSGREGIRNGRASFRGGLFGPNSHPSSSDQAYSQRADRIDPFRPSGGEGRRNGSASFRGGLFGPSSHPSISDQADSQARHQFGRAENMRPEARENAGAIQLGGMCWRKLTELNEKEPSEILQTIANERSEFYTQLQSEFIRSDMVVLILSIIAKGLSCDKEGSLIFFLNLLHKSIFFSKPFITYILTAIDATTLYQTKYRRPVKDSLIIMKSLLTRLPVCHKDLVPPLTTMQYVLQRTGDSLQDTETQELLSETIAARDAAREHEAKVAAAAAKSRSHRDVEPPNDFREMPILPTVKEIHTKERPFLRPNIAEGDYTNLQHYLDVQYRLIREDFVAPLREGISQFVESLQRDGGNNRIDDIRIYRDVHVLYPVCRDTGLAHVIRFSLQGLEHVRWEVSRRLMFGSLLCLSSDNFRNFYFATVCDRKAEALAEGFLTICFVKEDDQVINIHHDESFVIAESMAYFQVYQPVLRGLREIGEVDFPFRSYILKCQRETVNPKYTQKDDRPIIYDLTTILDSAETDEKDRKKKQLEAVLILESDKLPPSDNLGMDESQGKAFYSALTNEFALIQGPPGTGKTYVGLQIVKTLLHNQHYWRQNRMGNEAGCILLVCYTNHALDQFLEGIQEFHDKDIVRVGNRSKSETLEKYNLRNLRRNTRASDDLTPALERGLRTAFAQLKRLQDSIEYTQAPLDKLEKELLSESVLRAYMEPDHHDDLVAHKSARKRHQRPCIFEWLSMDYLQETNDESEEQIEIVEESEEDDIEENVVESGDKIDVEDEAAFIADQRMLEDDIVEEEISTKKATKGKSSPGLTPEPTTEEGEWQVPRATKTKMRKHLHQELHSSDIMSEDEVSRISNIWSLKNNDRWRLYRRWIQNFREDMMQQVRVVTEEYQTAAGHLVDLRSDMDLAILRNATVVGMTTTAAARYRTVLQQLGPKIIIVEEAAEVLEAHIVTALTSRCEHLILIGDHLQLRPNPTVYRLAKDYKLEISLFERMVGNGIPCKTLENQHRMRPEISKILRHIYPALQDDESVYQYENIRGITSSVYYIDHTYAESHNEETKSKSNKHEALYLVSLCQYLFKQGYEPSQITILTPYTGQLMLLKKHMPKKTFQGVRVCAIDNFQGEENDIILLSLVRSNAENKIGFLSEPNRVGVALSRAKKGFYVIGNFTLLCKNNSLWNTLVTSLTQQKVFGESLKLYCQNHPEDGEITVRIPRDFDLAPEGGCMKPCDYRLPCGHTCPLRCHSYDQEHKKTKCTKPCKKVVCSEGHTCSRDCHEECGSCNTLVWKVIPDCGHEQVMPCHRPPIEHRCREPCRTVLSCGHLCDNKCGEPHTKNCSVNVSHKFPCLHNAKIRCSEQNGPCREPCQALLSCEHPCSGTCGKCLQGRLHRPCDWFCDRTLVCGHPCQAGCTADCPPCNRPCENRCIHSRCHNKCGAPCEPCQEPCPWRCRHFKCTMLCHEPCDRPRCDQPCDKILKCGHHCIGLCGEKCPKKCRICHRKEVTEILFGNEDEDGARFVALEDCDHIIEVSALDHWMDHAQVNDSGEESIQLRTCPKCKTPVRSNLRYGTIINDTLRDIEVVKRLVYGDPDEIKRKTREVKRKLYYSCLPDEYHVDCDSKRVSMSMLISMENMANFVEVLCTIKKKTSKLNALEDKLSKDIDILLSWLGKYRCRVSDQELHDCQMELSRLNLLTTAYIFKEKITKYSYDENDVVTYNLDLVIRVLSAAGPLSFERQGMVETLLKQIAGSGGLGISDKERIQIVSAIGLSKGHWFKCRNGHVYVIGECGGAMEQSRCPECNAPIGGQSHRLEASNAVATEMDGARHAAYGDEANMDNYYPLDDFKD